MWGVNKMLFDTRDKIIFAGDSVTDMGRVHPLGEGMGDNLGHGYVRVIDSLIAACYPELELRIINAGNYGDSSRELRKRFNTDVVDLKPDWVSICIGINDVWRQFDVPGIVDLHVLPDEYEVNVEEMVKSVKDSVKGIFILSPYIMEPCRDDIMRKKMDEYAEISRKLADKHGCIFVDFQKLYEDYCSVCHSSRIAWDRIHPNQIGATLMARAFLKKVGFDYNRNL